MNPGYLKHYADKNWNNHSAITINESNKLILFDAHVEDDDNKSYYSHIYLSSNFRDLYIISTGNINLHLPERVDVKMEKNLLSNYFNITREYTLIMDSVDPDNSKLEFVKKEFKSSRPYIILNNEFGYIYEDAVNKIFCYNVDNDMKPIDDPRNPPKPLRVFYGFEIKTFMEQWNKVRLRNKGEVCNERDFYFNTYYPKHNYPIINVLYRSTTSPLIKLARAREEEFDNVVHDKTPKSAAPITQKEINSLVADKITPSNIPEVEANVFVPEKQNKPQPQPQTFNFPTPLYNNMFSSGFSQSPANQESKNNSNNTFNMFEHKDLH